MMCDSAYLYGGNASKRQRLGKECTILGGRNAMTDPTPVKDVKAVVSVKRHDRAENRTSELFRVQEPMTVVIFGASGDLSKRKLIPALYQLQNAGYLPDRYAVVGFSRTAMTDGAYRETMVKALQEQMTEETTAVQADHPLINA